jgi:hypothetical protein
MSDGVIAREHLKPDWLGYNQMRTAHPPDLKARATRSQPGATNRSHPDHVREQGRKE